MRSHGLATIALCEDYGLTRDKNVRAAAQKAIDFIELAQDQRNGGWRYGPGQRGDMSVVGWQLTALKTAEMAGLSVKPATLDRVKKWLQSCAHGGAAGTFSSKPDGEPTPAASAIGILANQYLGVDRSDPVITGGVQFLLKNEPDVAKHNVRYWYYATQAMHNMADNDWDTWNRKMRKILVETQAREGCASGSWDPDMPTRDVLRFQGGRVMVTSLSCLTLEVYFRSLPIYASDNP